MAKRTELEDELARQLDLAGIPYEREFYAIPGRRFRWDFRATRMDDCDWEWGKVLVEVHGGIWIKGGHSTGAGITRDAEKANLANLAGFTCLVVTKEMIKSRQALAWIQEAIK